MSYPGVYLAWPPERIAKLTQLLLTMTYEKAAVRLGCTKSAAVGALMRDTKRKRMEPPDPNPVHNTGRHDDGRYIEKWVDRKARRMRERDAARMELAA